MRARINGVLDTKLLPDSTTNLRLVNVFSAHNLVWLNFPSLIRFHATPEEVTRWLERDCIETSNIRLRALKGNQRLVSSWSSGVPNWWQPETAEQFVDYECDFREDDEFMDDRRNEIMIDQTNDNRWVVYLYSVDYW